VDTPSFLSFPHDGTGRATFAEGLFTGYRWFDARSIEPLFPFGHGLSYTAFAYDDLTLDKTILSDSEPLAISLRVRNTGTRAGQDIVQLYVRERRPRLPRPVKELRAFAKVALEPGKDTIVSFRLEGRDFAVYDPRVGAWTTPAGGYDLLVGASSRDIRLQASVCVEPVQEPDVHLDRTSPVREWLRLPLVRERLQPFLADLGRRLSGAPAGAPVGESQLVLAETLVNDMPIGRLILLGGPDDADIAELIAAIHGYGSAVPPGSTEH
jgi:beta-glucosidase